MYKTKSVFLLITIMGSLITIFSNSWISMWMGLEMNMMAFIPLIKENKSKATAEAMMIYFLIQSIGSALLMFSITVNYTFMESWTLMPLITFLALMIKMGAAPFHMWMPEIMSKMKWNSCIMLMTWQKLAPMTMTMNLNPKSEVLTIMVMMSIIVGAIGGINQTSLRKIMAYSSINHLGWMLSLIKIQSNWMMYLITYSMMVTSMCFMFNKYNMLFIPQINSMNMSISEKMAYITSMMSLGGLPPFIGFMPKWIVIQSMVNSNMIFVSLIMIMFSLITLFYYIRTMSTLIMNQSMINKWISSKSSKLIIMWMILLNFSLPMVYMVIFL
uniref:NADH dehydrogenase subunit 2 n=1 Tax=Megacopta cribriella TaxID=2968964 RepID=UPI002237AD59|nr:NADH dehydrogenase subunit 2 [Megacopta cribriella]UYA97720.1 NADH dehydrogenase subunit 2 [Megacopta cribriella]